MMNRKLTSVEKKKFEEERARRILMLFFPEKYSESYLSDRPDIVNVASGIGVEVTDSLLNAIQEKLSKAGSVSGRYGKDLERYEEEHRERGKTGAYELPSGQILSGFTFWGSTHDLVSAYNRKIESMNKEGFQLFEENNLFIYAWLSEEKVLLEFIHQLERDRGMGARDVSSEASGRRTFDLVYVFQEEKLLEIRLKDSHVTEYQVDSEELERISNEAYERVTGMRHLGYQGEPEPAELGES